MEVWNRNGYKIYKTKTYRCACYIIESGTVHVLVDTSMKFERSAIEKCILNVGIQRVDAVFLTHSHTDHVENVKYFSEIWGCPVYVSAKGLDRIRSGNCIMPKGTRLHSKLIYNLEQKIPFYDFTRFESCANVEVLNNTVVQSYLGAGAKLLETPGHTDDSLSIIIDHAIAIVGDAMVNSFGNQYPPFADNEEAVTASWLKLLDTQCELFCPAHGKPIHRKELIEAYQKVSAM